MSAHPVVSVIVPTYRRPEKLARALASVLLAVSVPHEIVVVDDCPQGTGFPAALSVGARYLNKGGRNRGLSASRNLGLDLAQGEWVAFLDDDDFFESGGLDNLICSAPTNVALLYGNYATVTAGVRTDKEVDQFTLDDFLVCNRIPAGAYIVRRGSIRQRFDERMRSHEDWDFLLRLLVEVRACHVPENVVVVDKTENETSSMQARRRDLFWMDFLSVYLRFPAPQLAVQRAAMLAGLGIMVPSHLLQQNDVI